jgi:hypothetical protein
VRRLACSVAWQFSFSVCRDLCCNCVAVSSIYPAPFSSTCSTQSDQNSLKLRLRCGCQFPWCTPAHIPGFEDLTMVDTKNCSEKVNRRFGGTYRLSLQGRRSCQARNQNEAYSKKCDVPPKHWLTVTRLHDVMSKKIRD